MQTLNRIIDEALSGHVFSAYQFLGFTSREHTSLAGGVQGYWEGAQPVDESTLFDIGSVTKSVLTASVLAIAVDRKLLSFSDPVHKFVPEWKSLKLGDRLIGDCLNHCSGLVGWLPIYESLGKSSFRQWMIDHEKEVVVAKPRARVEYSDFGPLVLGEVIRSLCGDLETPFREWVIEPLGLSEVEFGPVDSTRSAWTEFSEVRGRLLQGEVFDDNSYALGGRCSHAGLFATARGLLPWARAWMAAYRGNSSWLSQQTAQLFATAPKWVRDSSWAFGWDTKSAQGSSAGAHFSPKSFGHLGYPGCSVWIDPKNELGALFFTNRVHPSRLDERIRQVRPRVHDAFVKSLESA